MIRLYIFLSNLSKTIIGKLFFLLNYIICLLLFNWEKFYQYLNTPPRSDCHFRPTGGGIDFCVYGIYSISPIETVFYLVVSILTFPSTILTETILSLLKERNPLWCYETFDIIYLPIFALINSFYWLLLGYFVEIAHSEYLRRKPIRNQTKILFLDSD